MTLIGSTSTSNPLSSSKPSSLLSAEYRQLMRQRKEEASKPKRSVILFNDQTEGEGNRIASGISGAKKKAWSFVSFIFDSSSKIGRCKVSLRKIQRAKVAENSIILTLTSVTLHFPDLSAFPFFIPFPHSLPHNAYHTTPLFHLSGSHCQDCFFSQRKDGSSTSQRIKRCSIQSIRTISILDFQGFKRKN